jgi:hypothetical protein
VSSGEDFGGAQRPDAGLADRASVIQVAGDRTRALLLVGSDPAVRPTIAVMVPSCDYG